ncbi:MAG TPA: hypothetical protein VIF40_17575 [Methylosinus sp.]|jgi:hypothetical protein|uniref:hypothetical protein n=1 Tax=Hyphomicrobiales TaxID=356 RepID=UPI002F92D81A
MPTALWFCDNIGNSALPYVLLAMPIIGAYLYGQKRTRVAWILISVWVVTQVIISGLTNANCGG